jgi:hypothetical protein
VAFVACAFVVERLIAGNGARSGTSQLLVNVVLIGATTSTVGLTRRVVQLQKDEARNSLWEAGLVRVRSLSSLCSHYPARVRAEWRLVDHLGGLAN